MINKMPADPFFNDFDSNRAPPARPNPVQPPP